MVHSAPSRRPPGRRFLVLSALAGVVVLVAGIVGVALFLGSG
jgi:hypothetical protein